MGLRINQNIAAMNSYRNLSVSDGAMAKSLEKLSSGYRINRAADDAAGLSISEGLRAQVSGLKVAIRNAQDGVSVVQTAEGALTESHAILQRMRELAVQAANGGSQDSTAQTAANTEFGQLKTELDRIANTTKFGSQVLLDGTFGAKAAQITGFDADNSYVVTGGNNDIFALNINAAGSVNVVLTAGTYTMATLAAHVENTIKSALTASNATNQGYASKVSVSTATEGNGAAISLKITLPNTQTFTLADGAGAGNFIQDLSWNGTITAASGTGGTFQVGAYNSGNEQINVTISAMTQSGLSLSSAAVDTTLNAQSAIATLDTAIGTVSTARANLGAYQNRFEHTINNLNVAVENLSASESRIRDTDMAQEMVQFTRNQILSQAGTAMLAQANAAPQSVMQLLRG